MRQVRKHVLQAHQGRQETANPQAEQARRRREGRRRKGCRQEEEVIALFVSLLNSLIHSLNYILTITDPLSWHGRSLQVFSQ